MLLVAGLHDTSAAGRGGQEPPQSGPTASAPINLAEPRPRKTQVLLPAETDAQARKFSSELEYAKVRFEMSLDRGSHAW